MADRAAVPHRGAANGFTSTLPAALECNRFLGLRSIRFCLRNLTLFKTQRRAILRASAFGDGRFLFPTVSTLDERRCKAILTEAKGELEKEGVAFNLRLAVGIWIEVPAATLLDDQRAARWISFPWGRTI